MYQFNEANIPNKCIEQLNKEIYIADMLVHTLFNEIILKETDMINKMLEIQSKFEKYFGTTENTSKALRISKEQLTLKNFDEIIETQNKTLNSLENRIKVLNQQLEQKIKHNLEVIKLYNTILDEEDEDSENFARIIAASSGNLD